MANRVKVVCRIRPTIDPSTLEHTQEEDAVSVVSRAGQGQVSQHGRNKEEGDSEEVRFPDGTSFTMDAVYSQLSSQERLFKEVALPLVAEAFSGFNCTLFSYGQTGSGKTHTLQGKLALTAEAGSNGEVEDNAQRGIVPRTAEAIFARIDQLYKEHNTGNGPGGSTINDGDGGGGGGGGDQLGEIICEVKVSVMEIYQERLRDLLSVDTTATNAAQTVSSWNQAGTGTNNDRVNLRIREHVGGSVWVEGLTENVVRDTDEFNNYFLNALKKRVTGSHAMNKESSRSHLVCIINLRQSRPHAGTRVSSKIHLIDLAGSEMVRKTNASGERMCEAKHINKSLSALGNVIYALTSKPKASAATLRGGDEDEEGVNPLGGYTGADAYDLDTQQQVRGHKHVPYRDSKLTRLLQDSLGGNAKTVLILAIAAHRSHIQESVNTLKFGERARQLCTKPKMNTDIVNDEQKLRAALARAEARILALTEALDVQGEKGQGLLSGSHMELMYWANRQDENLPVVAAETRLVDTAANIKRVATPKVITDEYVCTMCAAVLGAMDEKVSISTLTTPAVVPTVAPVLTIAPAKNKKMEQQQQMQAKAAAAHKTVVKTKASVKDRYKEREREKAGSASNSRSNSATRLVRGTSREKGEKVQDLGLLGQWQAQADANRGSGVGDGERGRERGREGRGSKEHVADASDGNSSHLNVWGDVQVGDIFPHVDAVMEDTGKGLHSSNATPRSTLPEAKDAQLPRQGRGNAHDSLPITPRGWGYHAEAVAGIDPIMQKQQQVLQEQWKEKRHEEEAEQSEEEDDGRCAVCGLNEGESHQLCADTGEVLGDMFMCDGNCGCSYHARCVGFAKYPDTDAYVVPEGEWYCSACILANLNNSATKKRHANNGMFAGDDGDDNAPTEGDLDSGAILGDSPDKRVSHLQAEYHAMRRERNRILKQWQTEKQMVNLVSNKQKDLDKKREVELCSALETLSVVQLEVHRERQENKRLGELYDALLLQMGGGETGLLLGGTSLSTDVSGGEDDKRRNRRHLTRPVFDIDQSRKYNLSAIDTDTDKDKESTYTSESDMINSRPEDPGVANAIFQSKVMDHEKSMLGILQDPASSALRGPTSSESPTSKVVLSEGGGRHHLPPASLLRSSTNAGAINSSDNGEDEARSLQSSLLRLSSSLDLSNPANGEWKQTDVNLSQSTSKVQDRLKNLLASVQSEAENTREIRAQHQLRRDKILADREKGR